MTTDSMTVSRPGSEEPPSSEKWVIPNPEVAAKAQRRRFSASDKLRIVNLADQCKLPGETGALLRIEGLYSSQLCEWRKLRDSGALKALNGKGRGPKKKPVNPLQAELDRVRKEKACLEKKLKQAELIIEFQKKLRRSWRSPSAITTGANDDGSQRSPQRAGYYSGMRGY